MAEQSAISVEGVDLLVLRFPRGVFTDTIIHGLVASKQYSTAGDVRVRAWSEQEIAAWRASKARYDRWGRHVGSVIRRVGRSPVGDGLLQRVARRVGLPLTDPPDATVVVSSCMVDGRGWLDTGLAWTLSKDGLAWRFSTAEERANA